MKFADAQVGCSLQHSGCAQLQFHWNGGKSWTSRNFAFPSDIYGYSMPRRDRIYVVGDHGMIYRYRVVLADYKAKSILDAPLMPASASASN
jgi:hypothetical protein